MQYLVFSSSFIFDNTFIFEFIFFFSCAGTHENVTFFPRSITLTSVGDRLALKAQWNLTMSSQRNYSVVYVYISVVQAKLFNKLLVYSFCIFPTGCFGCRYFKPAGLHPVTLRVGVPNKLTTEFILYVEPFRASMLKCATVSTRLSLILLVMFPLSCIFKGEVNSLTSGSSCQTETFSVC